jgi:tRNA-specific 2-thiouridylase
MRIAAAMSGGVDSSTAAALLKNQGHEVVGFMLKLWDQRRNWTPDGDVLPSRCCSLDDVYDARSVAHHLGFPFYVLNMEEAFEREVVFPYVREYLSGRTPIPCMACNTRVKFGSLLEYAQTLGFERVATGHYARTEFDDATGRHLLKKGVDATRDQSYYLFGLTQEQLARTLFPLGALTKAEVRQLAAQLSMPVAAKDESQDVCFIPDDDYARFVEEYRLTGKLADGVKDIIGARRSELPSLPGEGDIVTTTGQALGRHRGVHRYTIGQRRGLNIAVGRPLYVTAIDWGHNRITVGGADDLLCATVRVERTNWIAIPALNGPVRVTAKVRYRHTEAPATIEPTGTDGVLIRFDEAQRAVTPGQAAVFYQGDVVVGGGWISGNDEGRRMDDEYQSAEG